MRTLTSFFREIYAQYLDAFSPAIPPLLRRLHVHVSFSGRLRVADKTRIAVALHQRRVGAFRRGTVAGRLSSDWSLVLDL